MNSRIGNILEILIARIQKFGTWIWRGLKQCARGY